MKKLVLYTCEDGIALMENDEVFGAWTREYRHHDSTDIKILVDKNAIKGTKQLHAYHVTKASAVTVVKNTELVIKEVFTVEELIV